MGNPTVTYREGFGFFNELTTASIPISQAQLQEFADLLHKSYSGRASGVTIAVGVFQFNADKSSKGVQGLFYAVNQDMLDNKGIAKKAEELGLTRWVSPMGDKGVSYTKHVVKHPLKSWFGATGHAEQLVLSGGQGGGVLALAVSRKCCPDCARVISQQFKHVHVSIPSAVVPIPEASNRFTKSKSVVANIAKAERELAALAKTEVALTKVARAIEIGKDLSVIYKIGKAAFLLYMPITLLDFIYTAASKFYEWDQERRNADKKELQQLIEFALTRNKVIRVSKDNMTIFNYEIGLQYEISEEINKTLFSYQNMGIEHWIKKWNLDKKWTGFLYSKVSIQFQIHQEQPLSFSKGDLRRYYFTTTSPAKVRFLTNPLLSDNSIKPVHEDMLFLPNDKRNLFTGENSTNFISGDKITGKYITFIIPLPVLTPFDFITIKCRSLVAEMINFISKYDETIFSGLQQFSTDDYFDYLRINWLEKRKFTLPLNSENIHYCLTEIDNVIQSIKQHTPDSNSDFSRGAVYELTEGHNKRRLLLRELTKKTIKGTTRFYQIGLRLNNITNTNIDSSHLMNLAFDLDKDIERAYLDCDSKNKYRSHHYEYSGPLVDE